MKPASETMRKLTWTDDRGDGHDGFWLPVGAVFPDQTDPSFDQTTTPFAIWMEEDFDPDDAYRQFQFLGSLRLGPLSMHVSAHPFHHSEGPDDEWRVINNDWVNTFIGDYGDQPQSFRIEGYDGDWILVAHPFC